MTNHQISHAAWYKMYDLEERASRIMRDFPGSVPLPDHASD